MTLLMLGLDGLDAGLVEHWDIDSFKLSKSSEIETFSYGHKRPYTLEVWPTIATGLHPKQHGIVKGDTSDWENPLLDFLSGFTFILPSDLQSKFGSYFNSVTGSEFSLASTSEETFFDGHQRVVQNWPGVTAGKELVDVWNMTKAGYSNNEFEREVLGKAAGQFGWAEEMLRHDPVLAGVHIHALDVFGHAYTAEQEGFAESTGRIHYLERTYRNIGQRVDKITESMSEGDDIFIISDHGMRNELIDQPDMDFGVHSYRAFAATTINDTLPETVFDVYNWIENHVEEGEAEEAMQMPKQQLRELGYIE